MWTMCEKMGEGRFFDEQLLMYARASGEDIRQLEEQMGHFINGSIAQNDEYQYE